MSEAEGIASAYQGWQALEQNRTARHQESLSEALREIIVLREPGYLKP